jgi:hypothetical protein
MPVHYYYYCFKGYINHFIIYKLTKKPLYPIANVNCVFVHGDKIINLLFKSTISINPEL